jgi:hypothetical protein
VTRYLVTLRETFTTDFHEVEADSPQQAKDVVRNEVETWKERSWGILGGDPRFGDNAGDTLLDGYVIARGVEEGA